MAGLNLEIRKAGRKRPLFPVFSSCSWYPYFTPFPKYRRLFGNQENWNGEVNISSFFLMFLISSFTFLSKFWGLSWEKGKSIPIAIWMGATTGGRRDSEPEKRISNTQVQGTRGARAWWMVGLSYVHSHLSLTWTLDILLMSFAYSVQHQQSWFAIAASFT